MRRITLWIGIVILIAFALPTPARAQNPTGIAMQATALYEGTSKYGEWLPVSVTLTNNGADVRGFVELQVTGSDNATTYAQMVELPRGARKLVTVYTVPNNFARRLIVTFRAENEEEPLAETEVNVRPVPTIRYVAAGISSGGSGLEALAGINFRGEEQDDNALMVPLTLEQLPDRPEALRTLDLLVIRGVDTSSLTPRQQAALEQYVALGGVLVLGGGTDAARVLAGLPDSLHPVDLAGESRLDTLPGLSAIGNEEVRVQGPFSVAHSTARSNTLVRYREGDTPLVVEYPLGDGAVIWMAVDPGLSPFDAWSGVESFWQNVIGKRAFYPPQMPPDVAPRQLQTQDLFYALQNLPSLELPSLQILVPVLAVYIILVGPVNYFVLRRQKRLELAWLTIPALTLLFSIGAYGLGYGLRGNDVIVNQVALIRGIEGGDSAYIRALVGIFSPSRSTYDLSINNDALLSPTAVDYDPFSGQPIGALEATLIQGQPALAQGMEVNQWSLRSVVAESFAPDGYGFEASFASQDGKLTGEVANNGDHIWHDVVIVLGTQFVKLGDINPGESKPVELEPDTSAFRDIYGVPYRIFESEMNQMNPPRDAQVKQQILSTLFSGAYSMEMETSLALSQSPVLLAWIGDETLSVSIGGNSRASSVSTSLFYSPLPLVYDTGEVSFIVGTLDTTVLSNTGNFCYSPAIASLSPDFSEAEIEFRLPVQGDAFVPSQLTLFISTDGGWEAPEVFLQNQQTGAWDPVPDVQQGATLIDNPAPYMTEAGTFIIQAKNPNRFSGSCLFFDAGVDGTLSEPIRVG
jgi:hypothetical protein